MYRQNMYNLYFVSKRKKIAKISFYKKKSITRKSRDNQRFSTETQAIAAISTSFSPVKCHQVQLICTVNSWPTLVWKMFKFTKNIWTDKCSEKISFIREKKNYKYSISLCSLCIELNANTKKKLKHFKTCYCYFIYEQKTQPNHHHHQTL